jgi:hypothetical protein
VVPSGNKIGSLREQIDQEVNVKLLTPIKAIRAKCLDCCCGSRNEVRACTIPDCSLYPYRFGRRPTPVERGEIGAALEGDTSAGTHYHLDDDNSVQGRP